MSVRCGNHRPTHGREAVHHDTVRDVRRCYEVGADAFAEELQHDWEAAAELAAERFWEDRGWAEAMLQEECEARAGVVPFSAAYAEAMGEGS